MSQVTHHGKTEHGSETRRLDCSKVSPTQGFQSRCSRKDVQHFITGSGCPRKLGAADERYILLKRCPSSVIS